MTYQKHSHFTKHLFCTHHLQPNILKKIPYSTRTYWRKQFRANKNIYDPNDTFSNTITNLKRSVAVLLDTLPKQKNKKRFWKKHLHTLTATIDKCNTTADKTQVLQYLNITTQAYAKWTTTSICTYSEYPLCVKKYPKQLTEAEKTIIKQYMHNPQFEFYNRSQVHWKMRNDKALMINLKTFHKYCDLMGLYKAKQKKQAKRKIQGITANHFLEKIHLDITYIGLLDNNTAYVLNIVDNHTRKLLASNAALVCNSKFVADTLEAVIVQHKLNDRHTEIITDGGAENFGAVTTMLQKYPHLKHTVAKRDTPYLNNIAEACHKRLKNNVLPHNYFTDINHLQQKLPDYTDQYNNLPQNHLKGLTPLDAEKGIVFDEQAQQKNCHAALQERIRKNKALHCCKMNI